MSLRLIVAGAFLAPLLLTVPAAADMGQIHVSLEGVTVSESSQKAIILHNDREEVLILGTELRASRNVPVVRFIPFPSEPQVALAPKGVFQRMGEIVKKYGLQYAYTMQSKGGPAELKREGVEVKLSTRLGAHDLTVIRVRDVATFRKWVNDYFRRKGLPHRAEYRTAETIVADYVKRGIDYFVLDAVELSAQEHFVDPVAYRFKSNSLYYPLKTSNSFGGAGEIELFIVAPTTLCAPGTNFFREHEDEAVDKAGRTTGPCLNLKVKASTSAMLVPKEHDVEAIYPAAATMFGDRPVFLQTIRYVGDYHFDDDVLLPMPQGVAKALDAPEPSSGEMPWNHNDIFLPQDRPQCRKAPDPGPCKGLFERSYFDTKTKMCKTFYWGGCQGEVPFETQQECEKTCLDHPPGKP